jgi:hypothetical protein
MKPANIFALFLVIAPDLKTTRSFLIEFQPIRGILPV